MIPLLLAPFSRGDLGNPFSKSLFRSSTSKNRQTATDCAFSARRNADVPNAIAHRRLLNSRGRWRWLLTKVPKILQQIWNEVLRNTSGFRKRARISPSRGGNALSSLPRRNRGEQEWGVLACSRDGGVARHSARPRRVEGRLRWGDPTAGASRDDIPAADGLHSSRGICGIWQLSYRSCVGGKPRGRRRGLCWRKSLERKGLYSG